MRLACVERLLQLCCHTCHTWKPVTNKPLSDCVSECHIVIAIFGCKLTVTLLSEFFILHQPHLPRCKNVKFKITSQWEVSLAKTL